MNKIYTIGIDIGGTNMKAVLFNGTKVIEHFTLGTPKDNLEHLLIMISALIEPLLEHAKKDKIKIAGIGLSIAGPVDFVEQKIVRSPNIPILDGVKLGQIIEKRFGYPVKMDNDGHCFILAEAKIGAGKKHSNIYGVTIGTGIGTAWWINNEVYRGYNSGAGEVAHTLINCNEIITLEKAYQYLTQNNPAQLAENAYRGDTLADKAFAEIGKILGIAFANLVNTLDPEIFIIGGGVMESESLFLPKIKKTMQEYIINTKSKKTKIIKARLGTDAGAIGAALLVNREA